MWLSIQLSILELNTIIKIVHLIEINLLLVRAFKIINIVVKSKIWYSFLSQKGLNEGFLESQYR